MKNIATLTLFLIFWGCGVTPQPINYGHDACSFCRMTIVDQQHSAQVVTSKGKAFKYDAIECMMNDLKNWDKPEVSLYLVADYANPGELTDAQKASYLISDDISSPMGAFLSAFTISENRDGFANEKSQSLNWIELKEEFDSYRLQ